MRQSEQLQPHEKLLSPAFLQSENEKQWIYPGQDQYDVLNETAIEQDVYVAEYARYNYCSQVVKR